MVRQFVCTDHPPLIHANVSRPLSPLQYLESPTNLAASNSSAGMDRRSSLHWPASSLFGRTMKIYCKDAAWQRNLLTFFPGAKSINTSH